MTKEVRLQASQQEADPAVEERRNLEFRGCDLLRLQGTHLFMIDQEGVVLIQPFQNLQIISNSPGFRGDPPQEEFGKGQGVGDIAAGLYFSAVL